MFWQTFPFPFRSGAEFFCVQSRSKISLSVPFSNEPPCAFPFSPSAITKTLVADKSLELLKLSTRNQTHNPSYARGDDGRRMTLLDPLAYRMWNLSCPHSMLSLRSERGGRVNLSLPTLRPMQTCVRRKNPALKTAPETSQRMSPNFEHQKRHNTESYLKN